MHGTEPSRVELVELALPSRACDGTDRSRKIRARVDAQGTHPHPGPLDPLSGCRIYLKPTNTTG